MRKNKLFINIHCVYQIRLRMFFKILSDIRLFEVRYNEDNMNSV